MNDSVTDIRGVLIQVTGARLLLPNATISEVLSYADPEPVSGAPAWLLGRLRWRGWQVPLIAFGRLSGVGDDQGGLGRKVLILKALGGDATLSHFALLTQGFPRLVTVARSALALDDIGDDALPPGVRARVQFNDEPALVPDLEAIQASIRTALEKAE